MEVFKFTVPDDGRASGDNEYIIFAKTRENADRLFAHFWAHDLDDTGWSGQDMTRFEASGDVTQMVVALNGNEEGLGVFDTVKGWTIVPVEQVG